MSLTASQVKTAKPSSKPFKMADSHGLFLLVNPNNSKYWRMKYRFSGKEKLLSFGVYPDVSLSEARVLAEEARRMLRNKEDPSIAKKNKKNKFVILDIPLLMENKINRKKDILIFVESKKAEILKRLKRRKNFDYKIINKFRKIQLPLDYKKKKSKFIIKNNFTNRFIKKQIKYILEQIY